MRRRTQALLGSSLAILLLVGSARADGPGRTDAQALIADPSRAIRDPAGLDRVLATSSRQERQAVARAVLRGWAEQGQRERSFATYENYVRMVRLIEAADPNASPEDVTRFLRRRYYGDNLFQFVGVKIGDREIEIDPAVERLVPFDLKRGWAEVIGPDGKRLDVGHSLVALDAFQTSPDLLGTFRAWLFTDFGDFATGIASKLGAKGAGNNNDVDIRGNDLGEDLIDAWKENQGSLSGLLAREGGLPETPPASTQTPAQTPARAPTAGASDALGALRR